MTDCTHERNLSKLRKDFGEIFRAALADSETVEIVLNSDGSLWHERLGEPLKKIGTMSASSADAAIRTLASYHHTTVTRENPCIARLSKSEGLLRAMALRLSPSAIVVRALHLFRCTSGIH